MKRNITDMDPIDIWYKMKRAGISQADLARAFEVSSSMISQVINGKPADRIRRGIADAIKIDVKAIWPSTYIIQGGPRGPGRPKSA